MIHLGRVLAIAPLSDISKAKRFAKFLPTLMRSGRQVVFWGWEREAGDHDRATSVPGVDERMVLSGGGSGSVITKLFYVFWACKVFLIAALARRNDTLLCQGFETAFPALIGAKISGARVIFDDPDRLSMAITLPSLLRRLIGSAERWASTKAEVHIVPSLSRYEWRGANMFVLRNTPTRHELYRAEAVAKSFPKKDDSFTVYINGWVGHTRGASIFLAALDDMMLDKVDMRVVMCGRVDSIDGEKLTKHPLVEYKGELNTIEALSWYYHSDVVLTFYDPSIPINRLAESNKWADCVLTGTPFVVNAEVTTAEQFVEERCCWAIPYSDYEGLAGLLRRLSIRGEEVRDAARRLSLFSEMFTPYDIREAELLKRI